MLSCLLNSCIMFALSLMCPLIAVMHGLTAPSCYTGFEGVQDGSRPMSAIGFLTSSSYLDRRHVRGVVNPADCASRGLYPSELIKHELWWQGPDWLKLPPSSWPDQSIPQPEPTPEEEKEVCFTTVVQSCDPVMLISKFSSFTRLKRVTAWIMRFIGNCRLKLKKQSMTSESQLSVTELQKAEVYWLSIIQKQYFPEEIARLKRSRTTQV